MKFGCNGCKFIAGGQPCGETQNLEIAQQLKELYEDKLQQIEADSGRSDYLQAKVNLQQQWISDLTQQNEMLVRAVEELEHEAIDRVAMLEERLRDSAQSNSDLRKADDENRALKNTILEANQKLEKLYEQANSYLVELDDYKQKYECMKTIEGMKVELEEGKVQFQNAAEAKEEAIRALKQSNQENLNELERTRRDSEAMSQAQNQIIQALQQALIDKESSQKVNESASTGSWHTTPSTPTISAKPSESSGFSEVTSSKGFSGVDELEPVSRGDITDADGESEALKMVSKMEASNIGGVDALEIEQALRRGSIGELQRLLQKLAEERDMERAKHKQEVASLKETIEEFEKRLGDGQLEISSMQTEECICELKNELIQQRMENTYLKQQLYSLTCELSAMQGVINEAKELQDAHEDQIRQNDVIRQELIEHIKNYQENCLLNKERTDYCQQEIENYKGNVTELKDKLLLTSKQLDKKIEQYNELETNYCVQGNTLACLEKQIARSQIHHEEDLHNLKGTNKELTEKMTEAENNYQTLHEDYKRVQAQVVELTRKEAMLQQDYKQKLDATQNEILCMNECINKLNMTNSSESLQKKIAEKELENLKNAFTKIKAEYNDLKTENEAKEHKLFIKLQDAHEDQIRQNDVTRQELIRQSKINEIDGIHLKELQEMVVEKSKESDHYKQQLFCCQKKLDMALGHNDELKTTITEHIKNYQENYLLNKERMDYCQQEIENYKGNVTELKDKLFLMSEQLDNKIEQYNELQTNYCVQGNTLACLEKQIAESQIQHEGTIKELTEKMTEAENNYKTLHEDYKRVQAQVVELTSKEAMLQQECIQSKQNYKQKLNTAQNEMVCMNECINKLNMAKSSERLQKKVIEEELENFKNGFAKIKVEYKDLKVENVKLKSQLCTIQRNMTSCKDDYKATKDQYNKCLEDMKNQQCEKRCLEVKNKQYRKELQTLRCDHEALNRSYDELFKKAQKKPSCPLKHSTSGGDFYYEEGEEEFVEEELPLTDIQRIERINRQLQKSSEYWESQMEDDNYYMVTKDQ